MKLFKKDRNVTKEIILGKHLDKYRKVIITNKRIIVETEKSKRTIPIKEVADVLLSNNIVEIRFKDKTIRDEHSITVNYIPDDRDIKILGLTMEQANKLYDAMSSAITMQ